jgi:hypothetical protein
VNKREGHSSMEQERDTRPVNGRGTRPWNKRGTLVQRTVERDNRPGIKRDGVFLPGKRHEGQSL